MRVLQKPRIIAEALRDNALTERDRFAFVIAAILLNGAIGDPGVLRYWSSPINFLSRLIVLCIILFGTRLSFRANQQGDGRQFLERYICLYTALAIRIYTTAFLLAWAATIAGFVIESSGFNSLTIRWLMAVLPYALILGALIYLFRTLYLLMLYVATSRN